MYQQQPASLRNTSLIFSSLHLFQGEKLRIKTEVPVCSSLSFASLPKNPASSFLPPPSQKRQAFSPGKNQSVIFDQKIKVLFENEKEKNPKASAGSRGGYGQCQQVPSTYNGIASF